MLIDDALTFEDEAVIEPKDLQYLASVTKLLFSDRSISGDKRRDIANRLFIVIDNVYPLTDVLPEEEDMVRREKLP